MITIKNSSDINIDISLLCQVNDYETLINCESVCKLWNELIEKSEGYEVRKENYFATKLMPELELFPSGLIDALGGKMAIYKLPILTLSYENAFNEYIDWLTPKDLADHSIWRGLDKLKRPFITFSYTQYGTSPFILGNAVRTIQKRYTDDIENLWTCAGNKTRDYYYPATSAYKTNDRIKDTLDRLKTLFSDGIEIQESKTTIFDSLFSGGIKMQGSKTTILGTNPFLMLEYDVFNFLR